VIEKLARSLADGGWLVLGPTEVPHAARCGLTPVRFPGVIFHRKGAPAAGMGEAFAPTREPAGFVHDAHFEPVYPEPLASVEAAPVTAETPPPAPEPASPFERARLLFEQGLYAEAIAAIEEGFPHGEPEPRAAILRARALANQGRLTAALSAVERLIAGDKLNAAAHYLRAGILQELGDAPEAAAALKRVLFLEPEFVLAHFALGNLARSQGRVAESVRHFENALALVRRHPPDRLLPESDGITAGRLALILSGLLAAKSAA
jgi:chemotaxis protein methyltransferase CheR